MAIINKRIERNIKLILLRTYGFIINNPETGLEIEVKKQLYNLKRDISNAQRAIKKFLELIKEYKILQDVTLQEIKNLWKEEELIQSEYLKQIQPKQELTEHQFQKLSKSEDLLKTISEDYILRVRIFKLNNPNLNQDQPSEAMQELLISHLLWIGSLGSKINSIGLDFNYMLTKASSGKEILRNFGKLENHIICDIFLDHQQTRLEKNLQIIIENEQLIENIKETQAIHKTELKELEQLIKMMREKQNINKLVLEKEQRNFELLFTANLLRDQKSSQIENAENLESIVERSLEDKTIQFQKLAYIQKKLLSIHEEQKKYLYLNKETEVIKTILPANKILYELSELETKLLESNLLAKELVKRLLQHIREEGEIFNLAISYTKALVSFPNEFNLKFLRNIETSNMACSITIGSIQKNKSFLEEILAHKNKAYNIYNKFLKIKAFFHNLEQAQISNLKIFTNKDSEIPISFTIDGEKYTFNIKYKELNYKDCIFNNILDNIRKICQKENIVFDYQTHEINGYKVMSLGKINQSVENIRIEGGFNGNFLVHSILNKTNLSQKLNENRENEILLDKYNISKAKQILEKQIECKSDEIVHFGSLMIDSAQNIINEKLSTEIQFNIDGTIYNGEFSYRNIATKEEIYSDILKLLKSYINNDNQIHIINGYKILIGNIGDSEIIKIMEEGIDIDDFMNSIINSTNIYNIERNQASLESELKEFITEIDKIMNEKIKTTVLVNINEEKYEFDFIYNKFDDKNKISKDILDSIQSLCKKLNITNMHLINGFKCELGEGNRLIIKDNTSLDNIVNSIIDKSIPPIRVFDQQAPDMEIELAGQNQIMQQEF